MKQKNSTNFKNSLEFHKIAKIGKAKNDLKIKVWNGISQSHHIIDNKSLEISTWTIITQKFMYISSNLM